MPWLIHLSLPEGGGVMIALLVAVSQFSFKICLRSVLNQSEAKLTHRFPRMMPAACLVLMNSPSC